MFFLSSKRSQKRVSAYPTIIFYLAKNECQDFNMTSFLTVIMSISIKNLTILLLYKLVP